MVRSTGAKALGASEKTATPSPERPGRRELWFLAVLCLAAALRVSFGAAALPIFADTDEDAHYDLVNKIARGTWPSDRVTYFDDDTLKTLIYNGSPEYQNAPLVSKDLPPYAPPVRDRLEEANTRGYIRFQYERLKHKPNHEAYEPPLYYALAAMWSGLCPSLGRPNTSPMYWAWTVYWIRFLNAPLFAGLVAAAYAFCRPRLGRDVALATAALTAFFPNTVYFTISNDVLSPLAVLVALWLLIRWVATEVPERWLAPAAGLAVAAALLVKLSNGSVLIATAAALLMRAWRVRRTGKLLAETWPLALAAAVPLVIWGLRNRFVLGSWSGTGGRILVRGLTPKPFVEWLDHPLFTFTGLATFLQALCASLFRGDSIWGARSEHYLPTEYFFLVASAILPAAGLAVALARRKRDRVASLTAGMCAIVVVTTVGQLAFMSLLFKFKPDAFPPSEQFPFYAFGRLAGGALVPFLTLYALGAQYLVVRRPALLAIIVLASIVMMLLGQWALLGQTLSSQYNWFHLR
jgi:4-amino-4-deoxy-L-arabinose transferase-like glycosyltransferase